ncbi:hypothetical protein F5Y15DRAFT_334375 [Xylariaceae sp. FL0016]|nr:hypothetical protein F5Y15DRAFT_334375 [Xylariaceae sp. FL0016]
MDVYGDAETVPANAWRMSDRSIGPLALSPEELYVLALAPAQRRRPARRRSLLAKKNLGFSTGGGLPPWALWTACLSGETSVIGEGEEGEMENLSDEELEHVYERIGDTAGEARKMLGDTWVARDAEWEREAGRRDETTEERPYCVFCRECRHAADFDHGILLPFDNLAPRSRYETIADHKGRMPVLSACTSTKNSVLSEPEDRYDDDLQQTYRVCAPFDGVPWWQCLARMSPDGFESLQLRAGCDFNSAAFREAEMLCTRRRRLSTSKDVPQKSPWKRIRWLSTDSSFRNWVKISMGFVMLILFFVVTMRSRGLSSRS